MAYLFDSGTFRLQSFTIWFSSNLKSSEGIVYDCAKCGKAAYEEQQFGLSIETDQTSDRLENRVEEVICVDLSTLFIWFIKCLENTAAEVFVFSIACKVRKTTRSTFF